MVTWTVGSNSIFVYTTKEFDVERSKDGTISMKPIKIPSGTSKPREDSDYHHLVTWTVECTSWNWTTEKFITPNFDILDSVQIDHLQNSCSVLIVSYKEDKKKI